MTSCHEGLLEYTVSQKSVKILSMRSQCVPGSLSHPRREEPGVKANCYRMLQTSGLLHSNGSLLYLVPTVFYPDVSEWFCKQTACTQLKFHSCIGDLESMWWGLAIEVK